MRCPKCQFDHQLQTTECLACGIIFSRYQAALEANQAALAAQRPLTPATPVPGSMRAEVLRELQYRIFALPLALLLAWLLARTPVRMAAGMLAMVLHESGHAITSWLTGRWAVPLLWVTMHGDSRSWGIVLGIAAAMGLLGLLAWKAQRWGWVLAAAAGLIVQMTFLSLPAESTIVFGGDAGAMVLATFLMAAFYAPRESMLCRSWGLRWGLLVIGALSFIHVLLMWTGPYEDLPFGEIEGVNLSDPSLLTEMFGWSVTQLVDRYVHLGRICLLALLVLYLCGLLSAYLEISRSPSPEKQRLAASR
jgi:hypothetical protein